MPIKFTGTITGNQPALRRSHYCSCGDRLNTTRAKACCPCWDTPQICRTRGRAQAEAGPEISLECPSESLCIRTVQQVGQERERIANPNDEREGRERGKGGRGQAEGGCVEFVIPSHVSPLFLLLLCYSSTVVKSKCVWWRQHFPPV